MRNLFTEFRVRFSFAVPCAAQSAFGLDIVDVRCTRIWADSANRAGGRNG